MPVLFDPQDRLLRRLRDDRDAAGVFDHFDLARAVAVIGVDLVDAQVEDAPFIDAPRGMDVHDALPCFGSNSHSQRSSSAALSCWSHKRSVNARSSRAIPWCRPRTRPNTSARAQ